MDYVLFILVNANLFIRPAEIVPELYGLRIYEFLILSCLLLSLPRIAEQFRQRALETRPITLCVLGLWIAGILSHVTQLEFEWAVRDGFEFLKVVLYYLLLVGVVNTPWRLRNFLHWIAIFCFVLALVAVLRFHGVLEINLPPPPAPKDGKVGNDHNQAAFVVERIEDSSGNVTELNRMRGTGIFQDPNDICLAIVVGILLSILTLSSPRSGALRLLCLFAIGLLLYALFLTQSRGGLLCFLAGVGTLFYAWYGWRKSLALGLALVPLVLIVFSSRMTELSAERGTGQQRIQIWSDGLLAFRQAPLFGIGMERFGELISKVAHNSFIHCFTELGIFGGTLFLGAFYIGIWTMHRFQERRMGIYRTDQRELAPYLLAIVVAYAVGLMSLSQSYIVTTYLVLGLVTIYAKITVVYPEPPKLRFDTRLVQRLALVSIAFLATAYVFVRVFVRWS